MHDEKGLDEQWFVVSEVSFENVTKVFDFIHVFANGEKCNCLFTSVLFFVCYDFKQKWTFCE